MPFPAFVWICFNEDNKKHIETQRACRLQNGSMYRHDQCSTTSSQHPHNTLTTPSQHPHNTLTTPSQHPHNTLTTPSQHPHNTLTTPPQHPHNTLTTPSQHPHNTLTTSSQHSHNILPSATLRLVLSFFLFFLFNLKFFNKKLLYLRIKC